MKHKCKCGESFSEFWMLLEHIAILNWRWPRISPDDKHGKVLPCE